jgi:hypothetical protein
VLRVPLTGSSRYGQKISTKKKKNKPPDALFNGKNNHRTLVKCLLISTYNVIEISGWCISGSRYHLSQLHCEIRRLTSQIMRQTFRRLIVESLLTAAEHSDQHK